MAPNDNKDEIRVDLMKSVGSGVAKSYNTSLGSPLNCHRLRS